MKSNGLAKKIHVSEQAYAELKKTGEFDIKFRGIVPLKNRGDMKVRLTRLVFELSVISVLLARGLQHKRQVRWAYV